MAGIGNCERIRFRFTRNLIRAVRRSNGKTENRFCYGYISCKGLEACTADAHDAAGTGTVRLHAYCY